MRGQWTWTQKESFPCLYPRRDPVTARGWILDVASRRSFLIVKVWSPSVELWRDHPPPPFCFQHQYMLLTMWVSCSAPIDTSLSAVAPPHSVTRTGAWMRCASYTAVFSANGYGIFLSMVKLLVYVWGAYTTFGYSLNGFDAYHSVHMVDECIYRGWVR